MEYKDSNEPSESLHRILNRIGISSIGELYGWSREELEELLDSYGIKDAEWPSLLEAVDILNRGHSLGADVSLDGPDDCDVVLSAEPNPIILGHCETPTLEGMRYTDPAVLPFGEKGLRRHVQIVGTTGSGKTVAARYIIEQAALAGVPSIVIDTKGDLRELDPIP